MRYTFSFQAEIVVTVSLLGLQEEDAFALATEKLRRVRDDVALGLDGVDIRPNYRKAQCTDKLPEPDPR